MPKFCSSCGSPLTGNTKFCPNCGAAVAQTVTPPEPAPSASPQYVQLAKPIPPGVQVTGDGGYQWTADHSVWGCLPFFKIMHIVCAVLTVPICILILAFEAGDSLSTALLYCLIAIAGMTVLDLLICLFYAAKRGFRIHTVCTVGKDGVSAVEVEAPSRNGFVLFIQLITGLMARGDVQYTFSTGYDKIRELTPSSDKTKISIKSGTGSGFLLTTPEQHHFVLDEIRIRMNRK